MKKIITIIIALIAIQGYSQITMPQPSPLSTVTQKLGLNDFTVTYSRPSAKGRKVFGDLVPYNELWRTGANKCTKFSTSDSVKVGGKKFGKGDYSLFAIPGEKEWTIIINKNADMSGTSNYKQEEDVVRFNVPVVTNSFTETFTIGFGNLTATSADVEITWENVKVKFAIEVSYDDKVMKNIDAVLNASPSSYFQAARYYYDTNRDSKQALEWINKALEMGGDKYWILRVKSLIQARLEDYKGAIETAVKSRDLAKADDDGTYVKMNEASIAEWTPKVVNNAKTNKKKK